MTPNPTPQAAGALRLHWSPKSPFVRKVMICAHELGLADRLTLVRSVAAMSRTNPAIMADNPLNKIPTLVLDDGTALFDSYVICEYLNALAGGGRLVPACGVARWEALRLHALADGLTDLLILWRNERDKPAARQTPDWLDAFAAKTAATLAVIEREADAIAARPFGIGHAALGAALGYLDFRFDDLDWRDGHPRAAAWFAGFSARPAAIATEVSDG